MKPIPSPTHGHLSPLCAGGLILVTLLLASCETSYEDHDRGYPRHDDDDGYYDPYGHGGHDPYGHPSDRHDRRRDDRRRDDGHRNDGHRNDGRRLGTGSVSGRLQLQGGHMPGGSQATVRIVDLSSGSVLAQQNLGTVTHNVIGFEVFFDPHLVSRSHTYNLEADVRSGGTVLMAPLGQVHVITHQNPTEGITLLLRPTGYSPAPQPGAQPPGRRVDIGRKYRGRR